MDPAFQRFCARVAIARDERAVAGLVLDEAARLADCVGYHALSTASSRPTLDSRVAIHVKGAPSGFVERYELHGRAGDPLLARVAATHSPACLDLSRVRATRRPPANEAERGYRRLIQEYPEIRHYLLSPLIVSGKLAGTLSFVRLEDRAFGSKDLRVAATMSLHVSSRLSALGRLQVLQARWERILTPRQSEVAQMVTRGFTNAEAGHALGVSANAVKKHLAQMFVKLDVGSRAELVRVLLLGPPEWMTS